MADNDYVISAKITADSAGFEKGIKSAQNSLKGFSSSISSAIKLAGGLFAVGSIAQLGKALSDMSQSYAKATQNIVRGTGAIGEQLKTLQKSVNASLINGVGRDASELGEMVADLNTRLGVTGDTLTELVSQFDDFSDVTGTDTKTAINSVSDVLAKWNIEASQTVPLLDQLTAASQASGASVTELTNGLKSGQAVFSQFGMSATQSIAFLGTLKKNGIETSSALVGLKMALAKFSSEGKNAQTAFAEISDKIRNAKTQTEALSIATQTFGQRNGAEFVRILSGGTEGVEAFTEALENAGGTLARTNEASRTSADALKDLKATIAGVFATSGTDNGLRDLIDDVAKAIRSFDFSSIKETFSNIGLFVQGVWEQIKELFNNLSGAIDVTGGNFKIFADIIYDNLNSAYQTIQDLVGMVSAVLNGDWSVAWEYAKLIVLRTVKQMEESVNNAIKLMPNLFNSVIEGYNWVLEQQDKLFLEIFHLPEKYFKSAKLPKFGGKDLIDTKSIEEAIEKVRKTIESKTGKIADKNLSDLKKQKEAVHDTTQSVTADIGSLGTAVTDMTKTAGIKVSDFFAEWTKQYEDLAGNWDKTFGDMANIGAQAMGDMFQQLGQDLVDGGVGFENYSAIAVQAISQVLVALSAQISALGVTHALTLDFAGAALAAAGAAAALAAAGALVAVAKNMKATKDATDSCNESLKEFKKRLDEIWSGKKSGSGIAQAMLDVDASIVQLNKDLAEANRKIKETSAAYKKLGDEHGTPLNNGNYLFYKNTVYFSEAIKLSKENKKAWDEYNETLKKIDAANAAYESKLREINEGIEEQIEGTKALVREQVNMYSTLSGFRDAYRPDEIWTEYSKYISNQLTANVQSLLDGVYDSFVTFGRGIGEKLMDSISEGATQSDFMESMRSYIRETMLKLAVYTEEFQEKLADAGRKMINSVMNGGGGLNAVADELARLYDSAAKAAETVDAALEKAFGKYRAVGEAAEETAETEEEIAVSIADQTDLLAEFADKLQEIKSKASAVKSEFDSMHKNATASIKGYAENYEEMIKSARQLMELKKEAASTLYQKYNATISPYNAAYVNYSAEQSRMNLAAQAVAEQKQKVAELEEKLKKVETLTTFGGIIERSIFSHTLDTAKINLADLEKKAASAEAAFNSAKNQWEESRAAYNSALEEYRSALAESKEAAAAYKSAMNNAFMELKLNIKETNAALDTQIDLLKKLQADMNIMADTIRINVKESYKSILGSLEETGTAIGDRLASSIAGGAQKSDFMLEMKEYVRQTTVKLAVYTESMQGRLANAGAKLAQGIMSGSSATIKLAQNMISSLYNDTSKIADKALAAVDDAFNGWNKTVKETNKTAKETASSASKTVKTLAELKAELRSLYKEFAFSGLIARGNLKSAVSAQLEKIESTVRSYYEGFASLGNDLGASLINGFKGGLSKSDMRLEVKDWIRTQVLQKTVYGTYGKQLAEIGAEVGSYLANGGSAALKAISSDIGSLYGKITAAMSGVDAALDSAFGKKLEESAGNVSTAAKETTKFADVVKNLKDTLADLGGDIAGKLTEGLKGGLSKNDMLATMKEYIKDMVIQSVVYTDSMKSRIESIGRSVANLITGSKTKGAVSSVKSSIGSLYDELAKKSESALKMIDEVFPEMPKTVEETTENTEKSLSKLESAIESFKEAVSDLGGDIAGELVSGLTEGLSQGDFLKNMKDWIRKTLVQSVVYTESLKGEIEAIGKTISSAVKGGMTETTMHEIRRDLSFIFEKASASMNSIDSVLSGVFDGYASGTTSALSGLHIVGEAGPELVRFKGGERVYNNADTMKMIAGAGKTNNMNITFNNLKDTSAFAMMSQLKQYNRELAINGIL